MIEAKKLIFSLSPIPIVICLIMNSAPHFFFLFFKNPQMRLKFNFVNQSVIFVPKQLFIHLIQLLSLIELFIILIC